MEVAIVANLLQERELVMDFISVSSQNVYDEMLIPQCDDIW